MKLQTLLVGTVLFGIGLVGMSAAGCSATVSGGAGASSGTTSSGGTITPNPKPTGAPSGCNDDPTLACPDPSTLGISCAAGSPPPDSATLICSYPVTNPDGTDGYCCADWVGGTCTPDGTITGCSPDTWGVSCPNGSASPDASDPTLTCSNPTTDPSTGDDLYCCTDTYTGGGSSSGGTIPAGCTSDSTVSCTGNAFGYSCAAGDNPEAEDPNLSCSIPETDPAGTGNDIFCCFDWSFGTSSCTPDDSLTAACPDFDSYGYSCDAPGDDPTSLDPSLTCSAGVADPDGVHTDFCCTYQ
jgi:hypothetical protein